MFTIFETLLILAIDDEEGDLLESVIDNLEPALAAAVLMELVVQNRVTLGDGRISVADPTPVGHPILDYALNAIANSSKMRKVKYWINTLTFEKLRSEISHHLVEAGVLVWKKKHLQLVVPFGDSADYKMSAKFALKNRLREIILAGKPSEQNELIQLGLLYQCDLLPLVFTRGERKAAVQKIKEMIIDHEAEPSVGKTLNELFRVASKLSE